MPTAQLSGVRSVFFYLPDYMGFPAPTPHSKSEGGPLVLDDVPVFRSGTFRDSWGEQHTWEPSDISSMVANFDQLRADNIVPHVPVRDSHKSLFSRGGEVVGWHTTLKAEERTSPVDGNKYNYLLASVEVTEPDAAGKVQRGTWRNRSAEVGRYTTNTDREIWPAYLGYAYVDLPAVEGLEGFEKSDKRQLYVFMSERGMIGMTVPTGGPTPPAPPTPGSGQQQASPPTPAPPQQFTIGGQATTDVAAVQAYIKTLETAQSEATAANRKAYVQRLAELKKITAPQIEGYEAYVVTLTADQYAAWVKLWDVAPVSSLLASHGTQTSPPTPDGGTTLAEQELKDAEDVVAMHKRAGTPREQLVKTNSYQKLKKAGREPA
jgi:hypothetical protein